ncbi:hypothetical protein T12_6831 [Trichinella patagoniensis]|uniref:Uncharacterized protein n=1 Tax=Trichinella patagoniensis TaxID=990121 RepID=A0A0V1A8Z2_9BILA|nr:hypothetical protein T12_6831 [Trichinella patagoniensis]
MSDYFGQRNKDIYPRTAASLCTPSHLTMSIINRENSFTSNQREETVDHVSLYLTPLAFGAPTGGNVPCLMIRNSLGLDLKVIWITLLCYRSSIDFQHSLKRSLGRSLRLFFLKISINFGIYENFAGGIAPSIA